MKARRNRVSRRASSAAPICDRAGADLPCSGKTGVCCTCRARLHEGKVEMAQNHSLDPWEVEAGCILACQSRPLTERVVVDADMP